MKIAFFFFFVYNSNIFQSPKIALKRERILHSMKQFMSSNQIHFNKRKSPLIIDGKKIRMNRQLTNEQIQNSPYTVTKVNVNESNMEDVVQQAIKASGVDNPIIIINNKLKMHLPHDQKEFLTTTSQTDTTYNMQVVRITDWTQLNIVLDTIVKMYEEFYQNLPSNLNKKLDQAEATQNQRLRSYMLTIQQFTKKIILQSPELMNNINYFERKIHLMQPGEGDMMVFYNLAVRYSKLKSDSSVISDSTLRQYWIKITDFVKKYNDLIDQIFKNSYDLYKLNVQFANSIRRINQQSKDSEQGAIDKFDQVLNLSSTLFQEKQNVEKSIQKIKKDMREIKLLEFKVDSQLLKIESRLRNKEYIIDGTAEKVTDSLYTEITKKPSQTFIHQILYISILLLI